MKPLMLAGAFLTALGLLALIFHNGIRYTARERLPKGGQVQVITHEERYLSVPPALGAAVLAGGLTMMILAARR
jgi:hypothetical protein